MSDHFNALVKIRVANSRFADEWLSDSVAGFRALCRDATPATNNNCAKFRGLGHHNKPPKHWFPTPCAPCCSSIVNRTAGALPRLLSLPASKAVCPTPMSRQR